MNNPSIFGDLDRSRSIGVAVTRCLRSSLHLDVRSIACECRCGVVLLQGHLSTFHGKQVAQEAVARVEAVDLVRNETNVG
jgi:hypothetical protein